MPLLRSFRSSEPDADSHSSFLLRSCKHQEDQQIHGWDGASDDDGPSAPLNENQDRESVCSVSELSFGEEDYHFPARSGWHRLWACCSGVGRRGIRRRSENRLPPSAGSNGSYLACFLRVLKRSRKACWLTFPLLSFFLILGLLQFASLILAVITSLFPDDLDWLVDHWGRSGQPGETLAHWPTDVTGGIIPVACHSHNDYWRPVPLYSAIQAGCIGVEADIWLFDEELYVGHTTSSLTANRTLKSLYINPLLEILDKQNPITNFRPIPSNPPNGVFDTNPSQTLVLLIDFKVNGIGIWERLVSQLSPLRDRGYLTHFNGTDVVEGPITVVGTGDVSFAFITANTTYRDVFFDAPLADLADLNPQWNSTDNVTSPSGPTSGEREDMPSVDFLCRSSAKRRTSSRCMSRNTGHKGAGPISYDATNSYYASVSFKKSIGFPWRFRLSSGQLALIRAQVRGAHHRGLKVRYWAIPSWPRNLRNHLWTVLVKEGVDVLNVDDLKSATTKDWSRSTWWT